MEKNYSNNINNQRIIGEAIRKIALGRSLERIDMSPGGNSPHGAWVCM